MLQLLQQLVHVRKKDRLSQHSELLNYVLKIFQENLKILQRCLSYTWKNCASRRRRFQRNRVRSKFWKLQY
ncbi:hypothetical protein GW17_00015533 [Ensete ventricosum]|nr:hypothetical protein GW17_00015533 [Ensete ventricosum]